jgi:hypothetical protein
LARFTDVEVIASGRGIRLIRDLRKKFGPGRWRKLKGTATIRMKSGTIREAEIHWYEAHGIGKKSIKVKRFVS